MFLRHIRKSCAHLFQDQKPPQTKKGNQYPLGWFNYPLIHISFRKSVIYLQPTHFKTRLESEITYRVFIGAYMVSIFRATILYYHANGLFEGLSKA